MVLYIYLATSVVIAAGTYINKREKLGIFLSAIVGFSWPIITLLLALTIIFDIHMRSKFKKFIVAKCNDMDLNVDTRNIKLKMEKGGKGLVILPDNDYTKDVMEEIGMERLTISTSRPPQGDDFN